MQVEGGRVGALFDDVTHGVLCRKKTEEKS